MVGVAPLGLAQGMQKGLVIGSVKKDGRPIVATIEGMIDEAIRYEPRLASHGRSLTLPTQPGKPKHELTPVFLLVEELYNIVVGNGLGKLHWGHTMFIAVTLVCSCS